MKKDNKVIFISMQSQYEEAQIKGEKYFRV